MEENTVYSEREDKAYHEAARAVAYVSIDRHFIEVTIISNEDLEGAVVTPIERIGVEEFLDVDEEEVCDQVFSLLVAPAIDMLRGSFPENLVKNDHEEAVEWASRSADPQATFDEQWARAEQFVRNPLHHAQIEIVAQALLEHDRLTYNEVVELLDGVG